MHNEANVIAPVFSLASRSKIRAVIRTAEMDFDGSRYYTINRVMLSSVGLWPYQNVWFTRVQRVFYFACVTTITTLQVSLT